MRLTVYILSTLTAMVIILGTLFKFMHWPGANNLLVLGYSFLAIFLIPLLAVYKYKRNNNQVIVN